MAAFEPAYNRTNGSEGGYVNDPDDPGAETYGGISRRWHPTWAGWKIIDQIKTRNKDFVHTVNSDARLKALKKEFYRQTYWNQLRLGELNSQDEASEIYDNAVNTGIPNAVKTAQRIAGLRETGEVDDLLINTLNHAA